MDVPPSKAESGAESENRRNAGNMPPSRNRPLMVDDALHYLEQVRQQFADKPEVYSNFLEVMKDFKSQDIDTQGVIRRVSQLFGDHPTLITGFNTFLPSGYEVQVHGNILRIIEPNGIVHMTMGGSRIEEPKIEDATMEPNSNGLMQPLKVNVAEDDGLSMDETLDQAVTILNKIRERYINQPEIYQQFLGLLNSYQSSVRNEGEDRSALYASLVQLFRNEPDLLEEFKAFLPSVVNEQMDLKGPKPKRLKMDSAKMKRLKVALEKPSVLNAFFHSMELYNHNQLARSDVFNILAPFFKHSPFLMRNLKEIFDQCEAEQKQSGTKLPVELRLVESKAQSLDYLTIRRMGQSYREQAPDKRDAVCSGRKVRHRMVLNDKWMAFASWQSEDSAAVSSKKTPYEETLWRIEDERFDYDICESILQASCGILSVIQSKIVAMEPRERKRYKLDSTYGCEKTPTLVPRCIKRVYGEHASKILSALRNSPEDAVPCVLKRLESTLEQMRKDKIVRSERWAEQTRACLSKSLDSQANFFRNNDAKFLRCRSIIQDIEKVFEERIKVFDGVKADGAFPPLVTISYPSDMSALFDAHYLIECTLLSQHLATEDLSNARFFLKFVLPTLLCVNLSDGESGVVIESEKADKFPLSYATQLNLPDFAHYMSSFVQTDAKTAKSRRCVYYGSTNFVLFVRLHSILCERLASLKSLCRRKKAEFEREQQLRKEKEEDYKRMGFNPGEYNAVKSLELRNPSKFYNDMLDMIKMLMDSSIDQVAYEDIMRSMFGVDAFPLYTMDKLLNGLNKYLTNLLQEPTSIVTFNLFKTFIRRRAVLDADLLSAEESHYEFMSTAALSGTICVKTSTLVTDRPVLCFDMLETPNVADWFHSYAQKLSYKMDVESTSGHTYLTYFDDARAIAPQSDCRTFLLRNLKRGATRLRSFKVHGYNLIEEEAPDESDESASDEDEYNNGSSDNGECRGGNASTSTRIQKVKQVVDFGDRSQASFLVKNDLIVHPVNTSFGFFTTYKGSYNLLLRRSAPYRASRNLNASTAIRRSAGLKRLLRQNSGPFPFSQSCTVQRREQSP